MSPPTSRRLSGWRVRARPVLVMAVACFKADPLRSVLSLVLRAVASISPVIFAAALASLVASARPGQPSSASVAAAVLLAAALGGQVVLDEMGWRVTQALEERTSHLVDLQVVGLVAGLPDLEHLERSENVDRVERIRYEQWLLSMSVPALLNFAVVLLRVGVSVAVLAAVHPVLTAVPLLAVPSLVAGARAQRIRQLGLDARRSNWRRVWDLFKLATRAGPAKELRVFGLGPEILRRHRAASEAIARWELESHLHTARMVLAGRVVFALGYMTAIGFVAREVGTGRLDVGALVLTVVLAGQVMSALGAVTDSGNWAAWTLSAVRRYVWLLDYANARGVAARGPAAVPGRPAPQSLVSGIRLTGVSFRYPGTDRDVLAGVDLFLPAGSTVAVVGDNGAGKTTLVKLLSRFYEPTAGRITVDGVDLAEIDVDGWRRRMAAAFQDHARLELQARQAIGVGDLDGLASDPDSPLGALDRAGATDLLGALPQRLETQLGPDWPEGVELSGGEWQKVALGRGMMREDPLVLTLDEPTAALDAETEHRLFDRYAQAARDSAEAAGTVTVLVSHRFSTVRMADLIVVVDGGRIAESGTHDELVAAGGLYAELYGMQAATYR